MLGKPEVWRGAISGAQSSSTTSYSSHGGYDHGNSGGVNIQFGGTRRYGRNVQASTTHHVNLMLDGRPVLFSGSTPGVLRDGDEAVLGGVVKNGVLKASAYRNLTNGASHKASSTLLMIMGVIFIVVGIPFTLLLIGFLFVGIGIFLVVLANHYGKINKLVEQAATGAPAAAASAPPAAEASPIVS